jgi:hypothetical protein
MDHSALTNMKRYMALAGLLSAALLTACEKNAVQDITAPPPASAVKFFNFGVNAPSVNFYASDTKMTAIVSATGAESALGVAYGSAGAGGLYTGITPGAYTLSGKISATVDKDLAISTTAVTLENGKKYSYFLSGFYNTTTKTVEGFVVEDPIPAIDYSVANVRFVNAISNSGPTVLSAKHTVTTTVTPVGPAVAYKTAGAFVALPPGVYDISARVSGAATDAVVRTALSFFGGRAYTITARGDITVVSTTAVTRPSLDFTSNW